MNYRNRQWELARFNGEGILPPQQSDIDILVIVLESYPKIRTRLLLGK
ncbi:protein of unknown function [Paenibacillus alvei]|uniref:Uncharacterized protein n=1 Tax=Paenibacillus alvei TaxID=44250 RepID=A0A383RD66_PAEAL|nr:protein of unknown function [Paenibacillus alvei]